MPFRPSTQRLLLTAVQTAVAAIMVPTMASAATTPDPFYQYTDGIPLTDIAPGTVLKSRTISVYVAGLKTSYKATQIVYRSTDAQQQPAANVTTIFTPDCATASACPNKNKVVSYQSFYDSLNPEDSPSRAFAGGKRLPDLLPAVETALFGSYVKKGYTVIISDTEGQKANFAAGPEYGYNTLDSIRAAFNSPQIGLSQNAKVALMGYSGGAIATEWAAELAPTYAPDVNDNLIGATFGGTLVSPEHNLTYIEGAPIWGGVMPMAVVGVSRSYGIDIQKYLTPRGIEVYNRIKNASIAYVLGQYGNVTWKDLVVPEYQDRTKLLEYVNAANKVIMGTGGTPSIPLQIGQGTGGIWEGTQPSPKWGKGDGVMLAGDVRTLARQYCAKGVKIQHKEYGSSHFLTIANWLPAATAWIDDRFAGKPVPDNCASIAAGNPLDPLVYAP
ncbi:triacylglycerol lipase [Aquabacterium sp. NJ1]|uniref:lipase family protein n=1 Tax=Aquabacterium sp. NJ1 TaxID=1538295 RepID=UPI00052E17AC|nr:lipase family protein [Aquabacterium sp. NJ1]KGM41125.1 triacylglycerol lipase [Aquabacterium sp. NJ1]